MAEKLITKSFERLLDKGKHRGFITYEELGKSLGKRNSTNENIERAFIILVDEKITLVEKKSQYQSNKKKETSSSEEKTTDKSDDPIRMYLREMGDVAKGIKSFKKGMASDVIDDSEPKNISEENKDSNNKD